MEDEEKCRLCGTQQPCDGCSTAPEPYNCDACGSISIRRAGSEEKCANPNCPSNDPYARPNIRMGECCYTCEFMDGMDDHCRVYCDMAGYGYRLFSTDKGFISMKCWMRCDDYRLTPNTVRLKAMQELVNEKKAELGQLVPDEPGFPEELQKDFEEGASGSGG